jgi:hypothetical protein
MRDFSMNQRCSTDIFQQVRVLAAVFLASLLMPSYLVQAQEACVVTSTGKVVCGMLQQKSKQSPVKHPVALVEDNEFRFELQGCQRRNERVRCDLVVTNVATTDRDIQLSGRSGTRGITTSGDEIMPQEVQLGKSKGVFASSNLVKDIPLRGAIIFEAVPRQLSSLSLLEVNYLHGSWRTVKFRNVSIQASLP